MPALRPSDVLPGSPNLRNVIVPAGKCDTCDRYVVRLWLTFSFRLFCAECVDAALAAAIEEDA